MKIRSTTTTKHNVHTAQTILAVKHTLWGGGRGSNCTYETYVLLKRSPTANFTAQCQ